MTAPIMAGLSGPVSSHRSLHQRSRGPLNVTAAKVSWDRTRVGALRFTEAGSRRAWSSCLDAVSPQHATLASTVKHLLGSPTSHVAVPCRAGSAHRFQTASGTCRAVACERLYAAPCVLQQA